jgi:hypothetical protein
MQIVCIALAIALGGAVGILVSCWRLRSAGSGMADNLRAVLRSGGQGEEQ